MFAFEVGVILIQGAYVEQNFIKGIEMIKIAEISGYKIPKSIIEGCYHAYVSQLYDELINRQYDGHTDLRNEYDPKSLINRNPIYQTSGSLHMIKMIFKLRGVGLNLRLSKITCQQSSYMLCLSMIKSHASTY